MVQKNINPFIRNYKAIDVEYREWQVGCLTYYNNDYYIQTPDGNKYKVYYYSICEETGIKDVHDKPIFTNDVVVLEHNLIHHKEQLPKYGYGLHEVPAYAGGTYSIFYRNYVVEFYPTGHECCGYRIRNKDVFKSLKQNQRCNQNITLIGSRFVIEDWQTHDFSNLMPKVKNFWE